MTTPGTPRRTIRVPTDLTDQIVEAMRRRFGTRAFRPCTFTDWLLAAVREKLDHMERSRKPRKRDASARSQDASGSTNPMQQGKTYEDYVAWIEEPRSSTSGAAPAEDTSEVDTELSGEVETMTAKELLYCQFARAWERMSATGACDAVGGAEFTRCWEEYSSQLPTVRLEDFIRERANVGPEPAPTVTKKGGAK